MDDDWRTRAACVGYDPDIWFPKSYGKDRIKKAERICADCPVAAQCWQFATSKGIPYGVFAGTTPAQRAQYIAGKTADPVLRDKLLRPHGTPGALRRHQRRHEPACQACKDAQQAYRVTLRAMKQAGYGRAVKGQASCSD